MAESTVEPAGNQLLARLPPEELERILPPMLEVAALISVRRPEIQFVVVVAPGRTSEEVRAIVRAQRATPEPLPSVA